MFKTNQGLTELENLLTTFIKYNTSLGYVQGMNFIAGSLLYHCSEEIAFWLFVMIMEDYELEEVYINKMPGLNKHFQIIDMIIMAYIPDLYSHFVFFTSVKIQ